MTRPKSSSILLGLILLLFLPTLSRAQRVRDLSARYRDWLNEEVNYIISNEEKGAFLHLSGDDERDKFIEHFWELRNPTPGAPSNEYKDEIYRRIAYAKQFLDGVHSDMGRIYITLGEPKQRAKYYGRMEVRPMEIWFYENANPALPPFFYVVFFDRDNTGTMRLYSPYMDGPSKLATSVLTANNNKASFNAIDRALGREVARTSLTLLPDEPVDLQSAQASLQSDVMLGIIKNLPNHPLTKEALNLKRAAERITVRIVLDEQFLDVLTTPLRDAAGNFNLHYLLRLRKPSDFAIMQADKKVFYDVEFTARVYGANNKLIFNQDKEVSKYLDTDEVERFKHSLFGYEGWLALAPGKYKIDFLLTNKLTKTAFKARREVMVPGAVTKGLQLSDVIAFSSAEAAGRGRDYLPFMAGGVKFTPILGEGLTFVSSQSLNVFYQVWGPPGDPRSYTGKQLMVDYAVGRLGIAGDAKTLHDEAAKDQFDSFGSMVTGKKIPLAIDAGTGNYRLVVSVGEPDNPQKAYSSLNFRVSTMAGTPPIFDVYDPELPDEVAKGAPEFDRALCYFSQNDKDSALIWFRAAFNKDPKNEIARSRLAELYFAKQDYADAAALFNRTPVTKETDDEAILRGAESIARTDDVAKAINFLEGTMNVRNPSGPLYMALANYYRKEGNIQKANQLESKGRALTKE